MFLTRMGEEREIDNPGDFIFQYQLNNSSLHIVDIEEVEVNTKELWEAATSECVSDHHESSQTLRFRYTYVDRQNGLLAIQDDGQVCVNGGLLDKETFFKVTHDEYNSCYQIICIKGRNQNKILYMDGVNLKTREYQHGKDEESTDTQFHFDVMGENCWEIRSKLTGKLLQFDTSTGAYVPPSSEDKVDSADPPVFCDADVGPRFQVFIPRKMKVTTV